MNSTFCTDLVSLFVNHLYDCDSCFDKFFGIILVLFVFIAFLVALIFLVSCAVENLLSKIFDRYRYKKLYNDLESKHLDLLAEYDHLASEYSVLDMEYDKLAKEYYHTCN